MNDRQRDEQMRRWIAAGEESTTPVHEDVIMWGVWFDVNGDEYKPPRAMFGDEEDAKTYAAESGEREYAISPCHIGSMKTRDDFRIPERTPAESSSS